MYHTPVMVERVLKFLECKSGGIYVDATLGGGGHSLEILKKIGNSGKLVGIDRDEEAIEESKKRLKKYSAKVEFVHSEFSDIAGVLSKLNIGAVDGMLADLGISSHQVDDVTRGFSFKGNLELDMRMNREQDLDARKVVNSLGEKELADLIYKYGEERHSRKIARNIVLHRRKKGAISTSQDLVKIILESVPGRKTKIHPATKTFQAIRIFVNDELGALERFVKSAPKFLNKNGVLVIISYHSLEDRIVKNAFRELKKSGDWDLITKKPHAASEEEIRNNPRARSAKLRAIKRKK